MAQSRAIPVDLDSAFHGTLVISIPTLFRHWYGPIGPVKAVLDQEGEWGIAGQTRTVILAGGGSMREELTLVEAPNAFGYTLTDIAGPLALLLSRVEGRWSFAQAGTGTRVTWQWSVYPKSRIAGAAVPVLDRLWRGYAGKALEVLSDELVQPISPS
jgi:Polyketide cyclase / dehydrase and lipid transport